MSSEGMQKDAIIEAFKLVDANGDGTISPAEIKCLLQGLDKRRWTDDALDELLNAIDKNEDGVLQVIEFWNWVNSAEGVAAGIPWEQMTAEARTKREQEMLEKWEAHRLDCEKAEAIEFSSKAAKDKNDFIRERVAVGMSRDVAQNMFQMADQDGDGCVDDQEKGSFNRYEAGTADQVKGFFKESFQSEDPEAPEGTVDQKAVESLLKAFAAWDVNGDGVLDNEEVARVFRIMNPKMPQQSIDAMIANVDESGDGYIDVFEFVEWLCARQLDPSKKKGKAKMKKKLKKQKAERQKAVAIGLERQGQEAP